MSKDTPQPKMPEKWDVPTWAEMVSTDQRDAEASEAADRAVYDALSRAIAEGKKDKGKPE
jgi:hypothetical protein